MCRLPSQAFVFRIKRFPGFSRGELVGLPSPNFDVARPAFMRWFLHVSSGVWMRQPLPFPRPAQVFNVRRVIDLLENVDTYTAVSTGTMEEGRPGLAGLPPSLQQVPVLKVLTFQAAQVFEIFFLCSGFY